MWCISQRIGSLHYPGRPTNCVHEQIFDRYGNSLHQHQERAPSHCVWLREVPHIPIWKNICHVKTDHKPLEMISLKNLIAAPVRMQRMLLRLQQYDLIITYRPGKEMLLANVLKFSTIQGGHWDPARPQGQCHFDVSIHPQPPDQDCSRNTERPDTFQGTQIDSERMAQQMHACTQNSQKLLGL